MATTSESCVYDACNGMAHLSVAPANGKAAPASLFSADLISKTVSDQLPEHYTMRPLRKNDFAKGVLDCLAQLTVVGTIAQQQFEDTFDQLVRQGCSHIVVIEDCERSQVVACGTLVLEQKLIRECGKIGHIEDIVVSSTERGKRLGLYMIQQLKYMAEKLDCYKIILNCSEKNVAFYEKCGLALKDVQMTEYFAK
ncbi:Glucosamine-phosphate N-acetyltransferase-like protein [Dimargaris xerosporica]|nr:Glucosamine-phosphate N-acetyltransferase-like protein [Dimargaris xerosporica]